MGPPPGVGVGPPRVGMGVGTGAEQQTRPALHLSCPRLVAVAGHEAIHLKTEPPCVTMPLPSLGAGQVVIVGVGGTRVAVGIGVAVGPGVGVGPEVGVGVGTKHVFSVQLFQDHLV